MQSYHNSRPIWSQEQYVKQFVKGNFMTIVAKPAIIEIGEWFAHQSECLTTPEMRASGMMTADPVIYTVSEHNRVLHYFIQCIISNDPNEPNICNAETCPRMTAGPRHSYTWLDSSRQQTYPPACEYINNVLRWMRGQVEDRRIFPIDPRTVSAAAATYASGSVNPAPAHTPGSAAPAGFNGPLSVSSGRTWVGKDSGFPESFNSICKGLCKQIFRIYAHLYWNHFVHPFYHVNLDAHLNSAFTTFICFAHVRDQVHTLIVHHR